MGSRWLVFEIDQEPSVESKPDSSAPAVERRPVAVGFHLPPPRRHFGWSAAVGLLLGIGALTSLIGSWLAATSSLDWNEAVSDSAVVREDLAVRSQLAASALTDEFADLEATVATLGDVSAALDTANFAAADLEAVAMGGPPSDPVELDQWVDALFRLTAALDDAFPIGPGDALQVASDTLASGVPVLGSVTGFGPFVLHHPLPGQPVTNNFGTHRGDSVHNGVDWGAPEGTPIRAAADGVVERAGWLDENAGNGVIVLHEDGWETRYFHMLSSELPVEVGDQVVAGQVIGEVGSTGLSTGPHLHFEIVYGPLRMDPLATSFTYRVGNAIEDVEPLATGSQASRVGVDAPAGEQPIEEIAALSDVLTRIADVQTELKDIAADASEGAHWLQSRSSDHQDRARAGALLLYIGVVAVALGLLLMWLTRPQWSPTG